MSSPLPPGGALPEGLQLPEVIITRRNRTVSMSGRIDHNVIQEGTVRFFCRSKGHGFIDPLVKDNSTLPSHPVFVHISDIEGEFIPRKGDKVRYHLCPMPPKFDKFQAVHLEIVDFTPEKHHKWSEKETPEELEEDRRAEEEEKAMKADGSIGKGTSMDI